MFNCVINKKNKVEKTLFLNINGNNEFVKSIQDFIDATWYDPAAALARGSFV